MYLLFHCKVMFLQLLLRFTHCCLEFIFAPAALISGPRQHVGLKEMVELQFIHCDNHLHGLKQLSCVFRPPGWDIAKRCVAGADYENGGIWSL